MYLVRRIDLTGQNISGTARTPRPMDPYATYFRRSAATVASWNEDSAAVIAEVQNPVFPHGYPEAIDRANRIGFHLLPSRGCQG